MASVMCRPPRRAAGPRAGPWDPSPRAGCSRGRGRPPARPARAPLAELGRDRRGHGPRRDLPHRHRPGGHRLELHPGALEDLHDRLDAIASGRREQHLALGAAARHQQVPQEQLLDRHRELPLGLEAHRLGDAALVGEGEGEHPVAAQRGRQHQPHRVAQQAPVLEHPQRHRQHRPQRVGLGVVARGLSDRLLEGVGGLHATQASRGHHHLHVVRAEIDADEFLGHVLVTPRACTSTPPAPSSASART